MLVALFEHTWFLNHLVKQNKKYHRKVLLTSFSFESHFRIPHTITLYDLAFDSRTHEIERTRIVLDNE